MRRILTLYLLLLFLSPVFLVNIHAADTNTDYLSFLEIVMPEGKLLRDFTKEEIDFYVDKARMKRTHELIRTNIAEAYTNVSATYIANVYYSYKNTSTSPINQKYDITIETNNTSSFQIGGSLSSSVKGSVGAIKGDVEAKINMQTSNSSSKSVKEKRSIDLVVEPNSQLIIFLEGEVLISNGIYALISFVGDVVAYNTYELVVLKSQYPRIEKVSYDN